MRIAKRLRGRYDHLLGAFSLPLAVVPVSWSAASQTASRKRQVIVKASKSALVTGTCVVGSALVALGIFADAVGVGGAPGFGWKQFLLVIAGALALLFAATWPRAGKRQGLLALSRKPDTDRRSPDTSENHSEGLRSGFRRSSLGAGVLCFGLVLPSVCWAAMDRAVWPWDQAWYGEVSVELWYLLTHEVAAWPWAMLHAFGLKPPGIAWVGQFFVPLGQALGSIEFGLLLFVIVTQWVTLLLIYRVGEELSRGCRFVPFVGTALAAAAPLFVGLSYQYFAEALQTLAVTYFFWLAARASKLGPWRIVSHGILATALAMLAKASSPLYCFLPGLIAVGYAVRRVAANPRRALKINWRQCAFVVAAVGLLALALTWYTINWEPMLKHVRFSSTSLHYGRRDLFFNKLIYWGTALLRAFFMKGAYWVVGCLVLAAFLSWCIRRLRVKSQLAPTPAFLVTFAGAAHVALALTVFSLNVNEYTRYLMPLTPSVAIVAMVAISAFPYKLLHGGLVALAAMQFCYVHAQALGVFPVDRAHVSRWLRPVTREAEKKAELTRLVRLTCTEATKYRYCMCGVDYSWLNHNSLSFYMRKRRLETGLLTYYTSVGYAATDEDKAWQRLNDLEIVYFISVREKMQGRPPNTLNQLSIPILRRIRQDERFVREPYDSRLGVLVYRNAKEMVQ